MASIVSLEIILKSFRLVINKKIVQLIENYV